jgi:uncharacterized protein (PEP-CTERM system associated)
VTAAHAALNVERLSQCLLRAPARVLVVLAGLTVLAAPIRADQWTLEPGFRIGPTISNNINLAPPGREESGAYLQVAPRIRFTGEGARYSVTGAYELAGYWYTTDRDSSFYSNAFLNGNATLVENLFFLDANARVTQNFLSAFDPVSITPGLASDNVYTTYSYGLSPYLRRVVSGYDYLLRWDNQWTTYSGEGTDALRDSYYSTLTARVSSPIRLFGWTVEYIGTDVRFNEQQPFDTDVVRGILYYQANPDLRLSARGGYEWNNYYFNQYSGPIYGAGVDWTPTPRTVLNGFWEERFFGPSYGVNLSHRTRLTGWRLSGSRNISTYPQQFAIRPGLTSEVVDAAFTARIPDPVQRAQAVEQFLQQTGLPPVLTQPVYYYNNQIRLVERVDAGFTLYGANSSLVLTAYWTYQEPITAVGTPIPGLLATQTYTTRGASANYTYRLSANTDLSFLALRVYTTYDSDVRPGSTTYNILRGLATFRLSPQSTLFAGVRYQWQDPTTAFYSEYREAGLFGGWDYSFK